MNHIESVIVAGVSGSGKTTWMHGLRQWNEQQGLVSIPKRLITRPPRQGDDLIENGHERPADFQDGVRSGQIILPWSRGLGEGRTEWYGFEKPEKDRLAVYAASLSFLRAGVEQSAAIRDLLGRSAVVLLETEHGVLEQRLVERSPDMSSEERSARLAETRLPHDEFLELTARTHYYDTTGMKSEGSAILTGLVESYLEVGELAVS